MSSCSENHIDTYEEILEQNKAWNAMHTKDCIEYLKTQGYVSIKGYEYCQDHECNEECLLKTECDEEGSLPCKYESEE